MINYFTLLGFPVGFRICLSQLEDRYQEAQLKAHPDVWGSSLLKKQSESLSAQINQAYQVLKNPLSRAQYLLNLKGHWPLPSLPHLMEQLLELQEKSLEEVLVCEQRALNQLTLAFDREDYPSAQEAYWWLQAATRCLKALSA